MSDSGTVQADPAPRAAIRPYLDIRSARNPALSPDGGLMAFLSDETGFHQIWLQPAGGGTAWRAAETEEPVGALAFSPKNRDLVFTMDRGGDERHQLWLIPGTDAAPVALTDDPTVVHVWGAWSPDGERIAYAANTRDRTHVDIHVMEVATRRATCVYQGELYREVMAFFPDGRALLVRDCTRAMTDQDLFRLDLDTGAYEPLLPHDGRARYAAAKFRKDGSGAYLLTDQGRDFQGVAFFSLADRSLRWLVTIEGKDVEAMALSPDQSRIAFVVNEEGWNRILIRDLDSGAETAVEGLPPGVIGSVSWRPDSSGLVFPLEGAATPPDIWGFDLTTGAAARITDASKGELDTGGFVEPVVRRASSFDGLQVPFLLYRPKGEAPAGGFPALVIVHGGPEAQWTPTFRADIQYMLARGIAVAAPNVRGSTGYGRPYQHLDDVELRMDSVADLRAVRLWLGAQDEIDETRIGIFGRSYGGFMVLAALTEYPELWRLGIEFYGIANFHTLLQTTGPWRRRLRAAEYGDPVADRDLLERVSPIHRLDRIRVPLLVAQGLDDPRVPPGESEMVHSCLRGLGRPVEYIRVPHEGHGFARLDNRQTVFGAVAAFLDRHL
ncbi:S9 family peptidase [Inquilinus limosus]|uniref:S9 family peptidase n=1 Tax=Inquilinus limosus TaxID=171674 RepID=UPI003F189865